MIITVTLNTAIDKTLSVPNFRLRHPPPYRRADDDAGRQGRQRRARLEDARLPGDRHRPDRRADRHANRRPAHPAVGASPSDFVRIREKSAPNTAVIDPTTGEQTEINERGPKVSEQEIELFVDKLLYLAKGASMCVFAGSLPREVDIDIYARLIPRAAPASASPPWSTPTATRCAAPCGRSPTSCPRTCSRPRSSSATSSMTTRTGSSPCTRWSASARARR